MKLLGMSSMANNRRMYAETYALLFGTLLPPVAPPYIGHLSGGNVEIFNGTFENNYVGIFLNGSTLVDIENSTFIDNQCGVYLRYSNNNLIANNTFVNCGLFVYDSYDNLVEDNTVNGGPLVYYEDLINFYVPGGGQIVLVNCSNVTFPITGNFYNTTVAIELWKTNFTGILGAEFKHNKVAIFVHGSKFVRIRDNDIMENELYGIYVCLLYTSPSPRDRG